PEDVFTIDGRLWIGASDRRAGAEASIVGDLTARLSYWNFGAELGLFGRGDALDTPHETYGALTYSFGQTKIAVGVPRPAYDAVAISAFESDLADLAIDRVQETRSAATFGAMYTNWIPYGVAVTGSRGALSFAGSVHYAELPDAYIIGAGARWSRDGWTLAGAVESNDGTLSAKAKIDRYFDKLSTSVAYFSPGAAGVSDVVELSATLRSMDRFGLTAVVQAPTDGSDVTAGVSGRYEISDRTSLALGVMTDAGTDATFSAAIDLNF
ncbi:MAG: hypothetical protein AAGP08_02595, partial [Pseudomonadota bacterium]